MNKTISENQHTLKCKTPIIILSLISLVCAILYSISFFTYYEPVLVDDNYVNKLSFEFPSLSNLIYVIFYLVPIVLLILYVLKFFKEFKATIIVPITFALIAVSSLLAFIYYFVSIIDIIFNDVAFSVKLINYLCVTVTFALATMSALKGLSNKKLIIIPTALGLAFNLWALINSFSAVSLYIEEGWYFHILANYAAFVATTTLYIASLLFVLNNRIPIILSLSPEKEKEKTEKMSPEKALKHLKDKLELGIITEEEYQAQRAEIISKL